MHTQRTPPAWATPAHSAQRLVLVELVLGPPQGGDRLDDLAAVLELPRRDVAEAARSLELAGLAHCDGDLAFASSPAAYFNALVPVGIRLSQYP